MCKLFRRCEGTNSIEHRRKFVPRLHKNSARKSLRPGGNVPKSSSLERDGCWASIGMPKTEGVGYVSLSERHGNPNEHGTAQDVWSGIAVPPSDMPHSRRCSPSRSHAALLIASTT